MTLGSVPRDAPDPVERRSQSVLGQGGAVGCGPVPALRGRQENSRFEAGVPLPRVAVPRSMDRDIR